MLVSPQKHVILLAFSLSKPCSNNIAEYIILLISMEVAREAGAKNLDANGDSILIVN